MAEYYCGIEKLSRWQSGWAKSMCFAAKGRLQGRAAKLLRARRKSWYTEIMGQICLTANGPAIEVVFVAESNGGDDLHPGYEDKSTKAVMSEAWRNFCPPGTSLMACLRDRGTM